MPITQILLTANSGGGGGGGGPIAYAGYTTTPVEGGNTTVTLTVENWDGSQVYWTVVGKGEPAADPNTDMTGQLTGVWNPGVTSFTQTDATIISFVANDGTEGTEYWGVLLGSSPGANDYYDSNAWPINEPLSSWTIEWWQKSNSTQPAQFPRVFALGSFPQEIGFSMEGVYFAWLGGSALGTNLGRSHTVWQHWAIVSDGINVRIYKDGVGVVLSNRINFGSIDNITDNLFIGSEPGGANGFKGLITNFRVVKGQAMYNPTQNTITVPTVPLWSNSNTELLLKAVDSGNLVKDSSSRNRIPVGTGSNAFSSDTPFATPTPASPVIITQGQSWNPEVNTLYISRTTFPDVDSVQTGWSFESANYTATVISAVTEFDLRIIALSINSGVMDGSVGTFTQYQVGGSIELFTSNAGYVAFDNGREWAFDLASSTYTLTPAANNVNEGSSLEFTVGGTNIINGTYYWTKSGTGGPLTEDNGNFTITNNSGSFTVTAEADSVTEGSETFTVSIRSYDIFGTVLATSELITINDTSLTPATYTLTPDADNVDEGSTLTFNVTGTNIVDGTYYWTIETSAGDFGANNGLVTITGNTGSFTVTPDADTATEGSETFTVSLRADSIAGDILVTSDPVTINDTSLTPDPTYQIAPRANNVNEGSSLTIDVSGTNVVDGTYYWTIQGNSGDFSTSSGEVEITNNAGSFTVTPDADATTEGSETFTIQLRSGSITGTVLATTDNDITINDTSLDPEPPFSLMFNTPQQDFLRVPASSDWNLGNNWTIEFWLKANNSSNAGINIPGGQWGLLNQGGWYTGMPNDNCILVGLAGGNLTINQSANDAIEFVEPTAQVWTHVAIVNDGGGSAQKVYYNGREQTKVSGSYTTNGKTNTSDDLYIGRLAPNYASYFDGKMTKVRISNTAKYLSEFTASVTYGVESDTRLLLDLGYPLSDTSYYELNNVSVVTNNLTTIFISKSAYPNLDKQVRVGNTVTKVSDSTTCIVTAPVFTADPSNWGVDVSPGWSGVATVNFSGARHTIVNNGTTVSGEFPNTFTGLVHPYNGGTFGITYCLANDPRFAEAAAIPVGARITSNIAGFGIRTVTDNTVSSGDRFIAYDSTGLTGFTSTSHVFNFYW